MKILCAPAMDGDEPLPPKPATPKQIALKLSTMAVRRKVTYDQLQSINEDAINDPSGLDQILEELEKRGIELVE